MAPVGMKEANFEAEIVAHLTNHGGYTQSAAGHFNPSLGLDTSELFAFIGATQAAKWDQLIKRYGGNPDTAQAGFAQRVSDELTHRGTLDVLRNGVKDQMLAFDLAVFAPATTMNETHAARYAANRVTVTRQLKYSAQHNNTIDLGLLVNGIPVATAELKNPLTGQNVNHAMHQYRTDRDPADPVLRRVLVHFAVDPYLVYMTSRLAKNDTVFLPFNLGRDGGKGNPAVTDGYATAYLWEHVWARHTWLDILHRFIARIGTGKDPAVVFPRFHQWDVVTRLEADAKAHGPGRRYLVQHSAGSGKSKSISWLAHRLSNLHDAADNKVFDKTVVITDRRVLDEQLRADVQEFEKVKGTVVSVLGDDQSKSADLLAALTNPAAKIIVTTLQVFPFLVGLDVPDDVAGRSYAVIVDEAHSSQTGDAANALRQALGAGVDLPEDVDGEDAINAVLAARGVQPNLSFFAFTATPKFKTIEIFGTRQADGTLGPFHLYSMRQAIEEGFILDVLANYTTYKTYFKLAVTSDKAGEQQVDASKASSTLRRMVVSDPDVIAQKAAIVVEHFRTHTAAKIGGDAKAMVVTDSRPAAVKYKRAIDAYIAQEGYTDLHTLVAFSGTVNDDVAGPVTESGLNGFPDTQTGARFKGRDPYKVGDYQVLIVAEKFQTGFDEPLLHTMFVDKVLTGLNTVQTLSRLNRTHPGKTDTFVMDFRNDVDNVRKDFSTYFQTTTASPTSPNALTDAHDRLYAAWNVLDSDEVATVVAAHFTNQIGSNLGGAYAAFAPALARFGALDDQHQADFRATLKSYLTMYAFMSQVLPWVDAELERSYIFGKALEHLLPRTVTGALDLGDDVVLTHLRIEATSSGSIDVDPAGTGPGSARPGEGKGHLADPRFESLAQITEELNKQFGLNLSDRDRLTFAQFEATWLDDQELRDVAHSNDLDGFRLEFERVFKGTILDNEVANKDLYDRIYTDPAFSKAVMDFYLLKMYELLRADR
ncbi:MAG: type I restriction endonuclease [Candidatus Nanopelagicales bacterium]|jgi:type I restriction enzyme R subunit|nr:type I restriction endonuclease [Candidatus Nanopelagicales bacterium]